MRNASLWYDAAYQPDQDWDDGEPDYEEGCPYCDRVKAGDRGVSMRHFSTYDYGYVHTLHGAVEDTWVLCQAQEPTEPPQ